MVLPRNVALVRVVADGRILVIVNERLNHDQEIAARVLAGVLSVSGEPYVLVTCTDVMAALHSAAA
jgi:hypothetical protein